MMPRIRLGPETGVIRTDEDAQHDRTLLVQMQCFARVGNSGARVIRKRRRCGVERRPRGSR